MNEFWYFVPFGTFYRTWDNQYGTQLRKRRHLNNHLFLTSIFEVLYWFSTCWIPIFPTFLDFFAFLSSINVLTFFLKNDLVTLIDNLKGVRSLVSPRPTYAFARFLELSLHLIHRKVAPYWVPEFPKKARKYPSILWKKNVL